MRILVDHSGPNGVGDIVMGLPLYEALADRYPGAHISSRGSRLIALGNPYVADLDESSPAASFDLIARASWASIVRSGGALPWVKVFLIANGLPPTYGPPRAYLFPDEIAAVELPPDAADRPVVGFSGDSVADPAKRWHLDRYARLLRHLVARDRAIVVELGAGYRAPYLGIGLNFVGRASIRQTMAILHGCDLYVGSHGGGCHLADAVGTPLVSPWGSFIPPRDRTFHPLSVMISPELPCKHCAYHGHRRPECEAADPDRGVAVCTDLITLDEMVAAAESLLEVVIAQRETLRAEKRQHLARPERYPARVEADATATTVTPESNTLDVVGRLGDRGQLLSCPMLVAAPDWRAPDSTWPAIVRRYVARAGLGYPLVLWLLAGPDQGLSLVDVRDLVFASLAAGGVGPVDLPPIVLVGGYVSPEQFAGLLRRAKAYLPTGGPGEPARLDRARRLGCPVVPQVP